MYGAEWCGYCATEKKEFGPAWEILKKNYVECSDEGSKEDQQKCEREGIRTFPAWKFRNGKTVKGYHPNFLPTLAEASGCD